MSRRSPECLDLLAGEYVMGALHGRARRRFEAMLRADADLGRRVDAWERRLARLADGVEPVEPPPWVWTRIERSLGLGHARPGRAGLWDSLPLWRSLAVAASLLVAVLTVLVSVQPGRGEAWGPAMIAHVIADRGALTARQAVSHEAVASALSHANFRLAGELGETTFLGYCLVGERIGIHLVVNTPEGRATVILLPGAEVRARQRESASGYEAAVLPLDGGIVGLVTDSPETLPAVEALVRRNITRL
jgi:hypothetical protein